MRSLAAIQARQQRVNSSGVPFLAVSRTPPSYDSKVAASRDVHSISSRKHWVDMENSQDWGAYDVDDINLAVDDPAGCPQLEEIFPSNMHDCN